MQAASRILVRAPNWAGDLVMATPGFRALRAAYPGAEITLQLRPALAPLVAGAPWFDHVRPLASYHQGASALLREARALRKGRFDLGIVLPDSFSSALLMRLAGVSRVVGYRTQGRRILLDLAVAPPRGFVARERHVLDLLEAAGCPPRGTELELFVTADEASRAEAALAEHGIAENEPLAVLAPGASYGPAKLWPAASFARVGDSLAAQGARVLVLGAPEEAELAMRVQSEMRAPAVSLAGVLDLGASKAVLRRARVLVCNDAGARHIAVALGTPSVVLFGPTSVEKTNLNLERVHVLEADVACRPCYRRHCPIDHRCMTRITPDTVTAAALSALENGAPSRDRSQDVRFPRSEPTASGASTRPAAEDEAQSNDRSTGARFPRSEPTASGASTRPAAEDEAQSNDRSTGARFPRSEPTASGASTRPAAEDEAQSNDRSTGARFPRSEPTASGASTRLAIEDEARSNDRSTGARFPRSEPTASGASTRLAVENEAQSNDRSIGARFPRSEPKASGESIRPASTRPALSIIVLTWNGRDLTLDCLASIEREVRSRRDAGRIETETIVVDNGSSDGTPAAVRERFPWARVLELPANRGFSGGNNAGLAEATGRHLCLLNNDTIVQHDALEACVRFLAAHPDVGVVAPALRYPDGRKQNSIHNFPTLLLELVPRGVLEVLAPRRYPSKRFAHAGPVDVEAVLGACLVVPRAALTRAGPMPEDYFFFLEETDWCWEMRRAGLRVVHLPEAQLVHVHGAGSKQVAPLATRIEYHRSLYHFFAKRRPAGAASAVIAIRIAKLLLGLMLLVPAALVSARERERWRQRAWIFAWHLAGRPVAWGLAGVALRSPSPDSCAERAPASTEIAH